MKSALGIALIVGLVSAVLLFKSEVNASVPALHNAEDHVNQHATVQQNIPLRVSSQDAALAYSLFMHHSSGIAMIALGVLMFVDRLLKSRRQAFGILIGCVWLLFGAFLFIKADPEGWPIGAAGFIESFRMPTANEWIQHKLLSLIPMLLGVYSILARFAPPTAIETFAAAGAAFLGGLGLMIHQHADHPGLDIVNLQHRYFALNAFVIAGGLLLERWGFMTSRSKAFLVPIGILVIGLQLATYVE
jgi:hypothetical protein